MRGLKLTLKERIDLMKKSHLLQMRGLKPRIYSDRESARSVASFTDAWIETTLQRRV